MAEIRRRRPRAADLEESEMPSEFTLEKFSQKPFYQEVNRRLVALARLRPGLRVVDLGAGAGAGGKGWGGGDRRGALGVRDRGGPAQPGEPRRRRRRLRPGRRRAAVA